MKKVIFTLSLIVSAVLLGSGAYAQEVTDGPQITVDKETHDYGTIEQGANGVCEFTITNTGSEPLIISLCKGSCGCTVPTCPKEPIPPGGTAVIKVKYDTNRVGPINKSVSITSNASNEPNKRIYIKGNIKAKAASNTPANN